MAGPIDAWRTSYLSTAMTFSVPGTVLGAAIGDGPIELAPSGDAVLDTTPMTGDEAFHIGSMTKLFTAALIMQLDQEGVLSLDDTIDSWFPAAPNGSRITVQMLLEHESGLYDLEMDLVGVASIQDVIDNVFAQAPIAEPGTAYQYLNAGYIILGQIAQDAAGAPYDQLVDERFIGPLRLTDTYLDGYGDGPDAVNGYELSCTGGTGSDCLGKPSTAQPVEPSPQWTGAWSAGGMVSTVRDQAVWFRALVAGDILDAAHLQLMQTLTPLSSTYYADAYSKAGITAVQLGEGAGLASWNVPGVGHCFGHAGSIPGSNGIGAYCPDEQLTIVILNNIDPAGLSPGYPGLVELSSAALTASREPVHEINPDVEVTFTSSGVNFVGSYRAPANTTGGVPAAVIIGGTGAVDRNGDGAGMVMAEYEWLADLLSAQGIASLRYDKLGTGETGLGPYTVDPERMLPLSYDELRIQPARDALAFLAAQPGIDPSRLILVGHSEGGAAAVTVGAKPGSGPAPAGLALIEPAYTHILDIVSRQFADQMDAAVAGSAMTAPDAAALKSWMTDGINEIRSGKSPYPAPGPVPLPNAADYTELMQTTIAGSIYGSDPAQMVITHAYRTLYGQGYDAIDPAALAPSITVPVLITCGTKDFNTPCGDGSPGSGVIALPAAFERGVAHFVELPNVVHILRNVGNAEVPNLADQIKYPFSTRLATEFSTFVAQLKN